MDVKAFVKWLEKYSGCEVFYIRTFVNWIYLKIILTVFLQMLLYFTFQRLNSKGVTTVEYSFKAQGDFVLFEPSR